MPEIREQAKRIGQKIRLYTAKELHDHYTGANDLPALWRKSEFIAQVLFHADEQKYYAPDMKVLHEIKDEFTSSTKLEVNLDSLYDREWLQTVTGIVHISTTIHGSIYSLKRVKHCKNELIFLKTLKTDKNENFLTGDLEKHIEQYQQDHAIELNIENAKNAHLISVEGEKVKINNVGYYDPVIDNWNEFLFLEYLTQKNYGDESNLIISKKQLTDIHLEHIKKYALTPALQDMLVLGLATETSESYVISLFNRNYCSHDTLDEAGAILWKSLNMTNTTLQPDRIMMKWFRKMEIKSDHRCDIHRFLIRGEKDQFNRAAVAVIMQEHSLEASPTEYRKALLDFHINRDLMSVQFAERFAKIEFAKDSKDAFDTMVAISRGQRATTDDYLYFGQSSRRIISYLVGQIVKSHSCEDFQMDRINDLIPKIHRKPYLLWTLCFWIWELKPELVPALMRNVAITSTLFFIQKKFVISEHSFESVADIKLKIASELFKYLLTILQSNVEAPLEQKAKIIFDCLISITTPQFQIKGQSPKLQREIQEAAVRLAENIKNELEDRPNQYPIYDGRVHVREKYYPALLNELFALIKTYDPENVHPNGVLDLDYEKLSLLLFLLKLSNGVPANDQQLRIPSYDIAQEILNSYIKTISATDAKSIDYDTWQIKLVKPIFVPASRNIEAIDWGAVYMLLEEENLANQFLNPANLTFNESGNEYDSYNRFIMDKLRCHLKILIVTYTQLNDRKKALWQKGILIESHLLRLQNAILDITVPNSLNEPTKRRFDIFNYIDERPTFRGVEDELIPQLGKLSNNFAAPEREKLINALLRTDSIVRIIKLVETMSSELDQALLLAHLNAYDLQKELDTIYSLNDIQFLLSTLSKHAQFQEKAREVEAYWDTNIVPRENGVLTNEIKATTYRTKLLLAFQANDLTAIENVPEPKGDVYLNTAKLYPQNEKDFYRALYYFQNDNPDQAYTLFNDLLYLKDDDSTTVALNRFAAKIRCAEKESDTSKRNILYSEALNEWNSYQKSLSPDTSLEHIAQNLLHNRLVVFDALEQYDEFDGFYSGLNYVERVKPGLFEIGVRNKVKRKMPPEAISLIKEAENFHRLKDGTLPDFVSEMHNLVVESDDPENLKNILGTLLTAKPDVLVKLIPDSVNDGKDPNSFILNCIVDAATDMLSNINAIAQVSNEDKYSDLICVSLNSAMKIYHWKVSPARGGFSNSILRNPGEIDLKIHASNNEELAICEALNLTGKNNYEVEKHNIKIFNYTPSKQGLFMLVYYKGPEKNFLSTWKKYKKSIQEEIDFPDSYQFEKGSFIDLSNKHNRAAIRIGSSSHGNGITLHHVFVNIEYKAIVKEAG